MGKMNHPGYDIPRPTKRQYYEVCDKLVSRLMESGEMGLSLMGHGSFFRDGDCNFGVSDQDFF
ncbi:MAG: hypothetical protein KKG60_00910 [Nanoarchaeota archaeon]|nr:hypothetical protein [Nanoarchaeota archaeon]